MLTIDFDFKKEIKIMKKGQVYEGYVSSVDFPNKARVAIPEEDKVVTVKNAVKGQKVRFLVNYVADLFRRFNELK